MSDAVQGPNGGGEEQPRDEQPRDEQARHSSTPDSRHVSKHGAAHDDRNDHHYGEEQRLFAFTNCAHYEVRSIQEATSKFSQTISAGSNQT